MVMRHFYLRHLAIPLTLLFALFYLFDGLGWDLLCSDAYFDASLGLWPYKHSWWANELLHDGGRNLILVIAATSLLLFALSFSRHSHWRQARRTTGYLLLCIALGTGLTAVGKKVSHRHCPKQYQRYGGTIPYQPILAPNNTHQATTHGDRGRCFPAGHASGAFSLIGLYFIGQRRSRTFALAGLSFSMILGLLFTFGQLVRGAHFISHSIATIILCWTIAVLLAPLVMNPDEQPLSTTHLE